MQMTMCVRRGGDQSDSYDIVNNTKLIYREVRGDSKDRGGGVLNYYNLVQNSLRVVHGILEFGLKKEPQKPQQLNANAEIVLTWR